MVKSTMYSVGDSSGLHRYSRNEPEYHHDIRPVAPARRPSEFRTPELLYRRFRGQQSTLSSREAIRKLSKTVNDALHLFQDFQSSFVCETSQIQYVDSQLLDYIWQDKIKYTEDQIVAMKTKAGNDKFAQQGQQTSIGLRAIVEHLRMWLDEAIKATADETHSSAGDNRSLAEKLNNSARDIESSLKHLWKTRKDIDTLITDLEILCVLLRRHGGGVGDPGSPDVDVKRGTPSRSTSYEHAHVEDDEDEGMYKDSCEDAGGDDQGQDGFDGDSENEASREGDDDGNKTSKDWGSQGKYLNQDTMFLFLLLTYPKPQDRRLKAGGNSV